MNRTVLVLKGLPASGKSTYAKKLLDPETDIKLGLQNTQKFIRVNKDNLRSMLFGTSWKPKDEKLVLSIRDYIIVEALKHNKNVIVDDTNLNPCHITNIENLVVNMKNVQIIVKDFKSSVETCIKRDSKRRVGKVGKDVIMEMYNKWIRKTEKIKYDPELKDCVIVDIDGTLANANGRNHYDMSSVIHDLPNNHIIEIVNALSTKYKIIIFSGRSDDGEDETVRWLTKYKVPCDGLHMRKLGDFRKDSIIKRELFDTHIRGRYNCHLVIDDRDQVVDMWRNDLGLKCLQVADGNF